MGDARGERRVPSRADSAELHDVPLEGRLLFAVPKKGRLHDQCIKLLEAIDLRFHRDNRLDIALCSNVDVAVVFLPAQDVAVYVAEGSVDMGVTGRDIIAERQLEVEEAVPLGFGKCRLCVQAPRGQYSSPHELCGKRIATSFPRLAKQFFASLAQAGPEPTVRYVSGSVEAACGLGLADGVVDLVETGDTMRAAGLEIVAEIMKTEAILISNPRSRYGDLVATIQRRVEGAIAAQRYVMIKYNMKRCDLAAALAITPGKRSATISPLDEHDWCAVEVLVLKSEANHKMDDLVKIGAVDILVLALTNCRV